MNNNEKRSLYSYIIITYGITWVCWIAALLSGYEDMSFQNLLNWDFESAKQMTAFFIFRLGVYGPLIASFVVTYHYYKDSGGVVSTIFSLAGFTMSIIGQTFIITWFYNNTRSVLITILFHAWLNTSTTYILGNITIVNPIMGIIPALVTWVIVFILLKKYGGETLTLVKD